MIDNRVAAGLLLLLAACSRPSSAPQELQGVIELHERRLGFEIPGRLRQLAVQRGQRVESGQLLAALEDGPELPEKGGRDEDARAAQAALDLLRAGVRREDLRATQAQLRAARSAEDVARKQLERTRELRGKDIVPQSQLDDAEARAAGARSEREAAEARSAAQLSGARAPELRQASARLRSAQAAVSAGEVRLARKLLVAPVAGVVLDTTAEPGEVLPAGGPVVVLGETRRPYVDVFVPQQDLKGVRLGAVAAVRVDAAAGSLRGKVADIGRALEFAPRFLFSPRERVNLVIRVRIDVDDEHEALHAGVPAFVRIEAGQ